MASATDDFNRANGGIGTDWTNSLNTVVINTNAITGGSAADCLTWRDAESFDADHSSRVTMTTDADGGGPSVRNQAVGANCYTFYFDGGTGGSMFEVNSGSFSQMGAAYDMSAFGTGQFMMLTATGTTMTPNRNGTNLATRTDATHAGGAPGVQCFGTTVRFDSWIGDPIAVVAANNPYNPWPQLAPILAQ